MKDNTYNGYTNYETWLFMIWNDLFLFTDEYCKEIAKSDSPLLYKVQDLKAYFEEIFFEFISYDKLQNSGFMYDLIHYAWNNIDFIEILDHLMTEVC